MPKACPYRWGKAYLPALTEGNGVLGTLETPETFGYCTKISMTILAKILLESNYVNPNTAIYLFGLIRRQIRANELNRL